MIRSLSRSARLPVAVLAALLLSPVGFAAEEKPLEALDGESVIATIAGSPVRLSDVQGRELHDLRTNYYQALLARLKERTLAALAERDRNLARRLDAKTKVPEEAVRRFYEENGLARDGSYEALAPRIRGYMQRQRRQRLKELHFARALESGLVKLHIAAPEAYIVEAPLGDPFTRGNPDARVVFMEFTDYQ